MAKPAKPVPFVTVVLDKQSSGAIPPGHKFAPGSAYSIEPPGLFVFDCPNALTGVLATLAEQYWQGQVTLRVTIEGFLREPSR